MTQRQPGPQPGKLPLKQLGPYKLLSDQTGADGETLWLARPAKASAGTLNRQVKPLTPLNWTTPPPALRQSFEQLSAALARLDHPAIWPLVEAGQAAGCFYLVLPDRTNTVSLEEKLAGPKPEPAQAVAIVEQLLEGLDFAHRQGVMHGSLSPANLWLSNGTVVALRNFGLAKFEFDNAGAALPHVRATRPEYLAPEQFIGSGDPRSDLYSAGVIIYRLLAGRLPFEGRNALEIGQRHLNDPLPLAELGLARPVESFLTQALAKNPADRFATAYAMSTAFAKVARLLLNGEEKAEPPLAAPHGAALPLERARGRGWVFS